MLDTNPAPTLTLSDARIVTPRGIVEGALRIESLECHAHGKPALRRGIEHCCVIGGRYKRIPQPFHLPEHLVDHAALPAPAGFCTIGKKVVGLIDEQHSARPRGIMKRPSHELFGASDKGIEKVRAPLLKHLHPQLISKVPRICALTGT